MVRHWTGTLPYHTDNLVALLLLVKHYKITDPQFASKLDAAYNTSLANQSYKDDVACVLSALITAFRALEGE